MTKQEAVVIETYTGICMLTGDDRRLAYEYAEKLLGHPIYTHEFPKYADKLKELSKPDFIEICRKLGDWMVWCKLRNIPCINPEPDGLENCRYCEKYSFEKYLEYKK